MRAATRLRGRIFYWANRCMIKNLPMGGLRQRDNAWSEWLMHKITHEISKRWFFSAYSFRTRSRASITSYPHCLDRGPLKPPMVNLGNANTFKIWEMRRNQCYIETRTFHMIDANDDHAINWLQFSKQLSQTIWRTPFSDLIFRPWLIDLATLIHQKTRQNSIRHGGRMISPLFINYAMRVTFLR